MKFQRILNSIVFLIFIIFLSCEEKFENIEKFKRPQWLAGKLYDQILKEEQLTTFAKCLQLTGYDTIINKSGCYTVFAPNDDAFKLFFQEHPQYKTIENIPKEELLRLVKFHIVQNPWSKEQLLSIDVYGWIDTLDELNNKPRGYKRETLLKEKEYVFGVKYDQELKKNIIVDTNLAPLKRKQAIDSRKYVPIFFKKYFDIYKLSTNDYSFYFDRTFDDKNDVYYANAKIIKADIFAENGFIHVIDRVVLPFKNAYEILSDNSNNYSYKKFLDLIFLFPEFRYNQVKTLQQPGAKEGLKVDSLFDISYPQLVFDISNEITKAPPSVVGLPSNVTTRYHYGIIAPTDEAMDEFNNMYFVGSTKWGSIKNAPIFIKRMIINTHMSYNPIYLTNIKNGFYNGENDFITFDLESIVEKKYGSNCSFIGINKVIVPRALSSIVGPIYLNRDYSITMYAIEKSGLISALKKKDNNYCLFVEPDSKCRYDSTLIYDHVNERFYTFLTFQVTGSTYRRIDLTDNDIRNLIMNHVAIGIPKRIARKEFLKNLAGNYIIFNNVTGEVSGPSPTVYGYNGTTVVNVYPQQISENADNGITYSISNWLNFNVNNVYTYISTNYPGFHNLLVKAGLVNNKLYKYTFLSDNEEYTVFVPNQQALTDYNVDTIPIQKLKDFCMLHFVQGHMIFTDKGKPSGYYETTRIDERSTTFTKVYTKIYLQTEIDKIIIKDKYGNDYVIINESNLTNKIMGYLSGSENDVIKLYNSNTVVHEVNKVLVKNYLDTN